MQASKPSSSSGPSDANILRFGAPLFTQTPVLPSAVRVSPNVSEEAEKHGWFRSSGWELPYAQRGEPGLFAGCPNAPRSHGETYSRRGERFTRDTNRGRKCD